LDARLTWGRKTIPLLGSWPLRAGVSAMEPADRRRRFSPKSLLPLALSLRQSFADRCSDPPTQPEKSGRKHALSVALVWFDRAGTSPWGRRHSRARVDGAG